MIGLSCNSLKNVDVRFVAISNVSERNTIYILCMCSIYVSICMFRKYVCIELSIGYVSILYEYEVCICYITIYII
jgi:hypothetical protein